jgi:hypothetical protein
MVVIGLALASWNPGPPYLGNPAIPGESAFACSGGISGGIIGDYAPQWAGGFPKDLPPRQGTVEYDAWRKKKEAEADRDKSKAPPARAQRKKPALQPRRCPPRPRRGAGMNMTGRAGGRLLQQARHVRAMDQGRQRCDQVDAAVVRTFAANAVRLQLHALAYNLGNFLRTLATPEPIKVWSLTSLKEKLIKNRREGCQPRPLCRLPDGGGRDSAQSVRRHPAADRGAAPAADHVDSVRRSVSKSNRQKECVQMPGKMARSDPRPAFGYPEVLVAVSTSRLSCKRAWKTRTLMPVGDSSGESR